MPRVRAVFVSDVHLGTRACQAERLLGFLREYESEYLYLFGDIIDFWAMNRSVLEDAVARAAAERGLDGVICGHIHWASDRQLGGVRYLNCGDWVDSGSGIVEHLDGRFEVVCWGVADDEGGDACVVVADSEIRPRSRPVCMPSAPFHPDGRSCSPVTACTGPVEVAATAV